MSNLSTHLSKAYGVGNATSVAAAIAANNVYKDANGQVRVAGTGIIVAGMPEMVDDSLQTYKFRPLHGARGPFPTNPVTPA